MPGDPMWWAYDTEERWFPYDTREEAERAAAEILANDTRLAIEDDEWPDGVESTCWSIILHHIVEHEVEEEVYGELRQSVTYTLEPVSGAIEAVLGMATTEQLRAELALRESPLLGGEAPAADQPAASTPLARVDANLARDYNLPADVAARVAEVLRSRHIAGETVADLAQDYDLPPEVVEGIVDWRAALTAAGLVRDGDAWVRRNWSGEVAEVWPTSGGWYAAEPASPDLYDTEEAAARAWLAAQGGAEMARREVPDAE